MDWIEYKLLNGHIAVTDCPDKRKKMDGSCKKVGSTACMLCTAHMGMTFYDDGSGGMVKCEAARPVRGVKQRKAGKKVKPSLTRKMEAIKKSKEEDKKINREIDKVKREVREAKKERRLKDEVTKNNQKKSSGPIMPERST